MGSNSIAKRVSRLRLANSDLAERAHLHENTVGRALAPEPRILTATQRKLEDAVAAEEFALRDYLIDLHPLPQGNAS